LLVMPALVALVFRRARADRLPVAR
jgi:hypothetical protein